MLRPRRLGSKANFLARIAFSEFPLRSVVGFIVLLGVIQVGSRDRGMDPYSASYTTLLVQQLPFFRSLIASQPR